MNNLFFENTCEWLRRRFQSRFALLRSQSGSRQNGRCCRFQRSDTGRKGILAVLPDVACNDALIWRSLPLKSPDLLYHASCCSVKNRVGDFCCIHTCRENPENVIVRLTESFAQRGVFAPCRAFVASRDVLSRFEPNKRKRSRKIKSALVEKAYVLL